MQPQVSEELPFDRTQYPFFPVRRFFARLLDVYLIALLWKAFLCAGPHVNMNYREWPRALDCVAVLDLSIEIELVE